MVEVVCEPEPASALKETPSPVGWRVKIWITPPIASEPYRDDSGPRTISTRLIWSTGKYWIGVALSVLDPMRTPSTSTSTWLEFVPRSDIVETLPRPPLFVI